MTASIPMRRHHTQRLKKKRSTYKGGHAGSTPRMLGIYLHNPCTCSCWMCGNERKYFKKRTVKELSDIEMINKGLV